MVERVSPWLLPCSYKHLYCLNEAFAASVWLNDVFLGTSFGKYVQENHLDHSIDDLPISSTNNRNILEETDDKFTFPNGSVVAGQDNVITIVQDNMGLNETQGCKLA